MFVQLWEWLNSSTTAAAPVSGAGLEVKRESVHKKYGHSVRESKGTLELVRMNWNLWGWAGNHVNLSTSPVIQLQWYGWLAEEASVICRGYEYIPGPKEQEKEI